MGLLVCITVVSMAAMATADVPDLELSTAEYSGDTPPVGQAFLYNLPDGTGNSFDEATGGDATIELTLRNESGDPIANYPFEDLELQPTDVNGDDSFAPCESGTVADANTDELGQTEWNDPLFAGGYTDPVVDIVQVYVSGAPLDGPGFNLQFNSSDVNSDGVVNLLDVSAFSTDFYGGLNPFESDFNHDGVVNLLDVSILASGFGAICPGEG
jgi:hypothetical protein